MSLAINTVKPKNTERWVHYTDSKDKVLASFLVRNIGFKSYRVALERANNQIASKGFDVDSADKNDKLFHELILDAVACHLIADWKGLVDEEGKDIIFTTEKAKEILTFGDIGMLIWHFVRDEAQKLQDEIDQERFEILGKSENCTNGQKSEAQQDETQSNEL